MSRRKREYVQGGRVGGKHQVKVTPEEEVTIGMAADREGVSWVRFVVEAGMAVARAEDGGVPETPTARRRQVAQLFALQGQIGEVAFQAKKVGVNVNQLTRSVHQGGALPVEEMRAFLAEERQHLVEARALYERVGELIDERAAAGLGS